MVKKRKSNISTRTQLMVATGTVLLLTAFGLLVGWLDTSMDWQLGADKTTVSLSDVTLKGESTCLEHKGNGPNDMMCAMGIKTASGAVYAIQGDAVPAADNTLEVTGTLRSASNNETYKIDGTITVK